MRIRNRRKITWREGLAADRIAARIAVYEAKCREDDETRARILWQSETIRRPGTFADFYTDWNV